MAARRVPYKYASVLTEEFLRQRYLEERQSSVDIAAEVGIRDATVRNYLKRYSIPIRTIPEIRQNYVDSVGFSDLSTDWHAYWTGFIAADGCVYVDEKKNEARLQLVLKMSDADHLRDFREGVNAAVPVVVRNNGQRDIAKIVVHDPYLVAALAKWGIVPNKTLVMPWPDHLPENMVPAYIRGYFDGDGTIYQRHRSDKYSSWTETICRFSSGCVPFLDGLERELHKRGIQTIKRYHNQDSNAYVLPLSGRKENLLAFADMMYQGSTVSLPRKKAIFDLLRERQINRIISS
jgi:hypothetical protein